MCSDDCSKRKSPVPDLSTVSPLSSSTQRPYTLNIRVSVTSAYTPKFTWDAVWSRLVEYIHVKSRVVNNIQWTLRVLHVPTIPNKPKPAVSSVNSSAHSPNARAKLQKEFHPQHLQPNCRGVNSIAQSLTDTSIAHNDDNTGDNNNGGRLRTPLCRFYGQPVYGTR